MKKKPFIPKPALVAEMVKALEAAKRGLVNYSNIGKMAESDMMPNGYCKPLHRVCDVLDEYKLAARKTRKE